MSYKEALNILLDSTPIEIIDESYDTPEYFEFRGTCGGDALRYRVYKKDGTIYEK